MVFQRVPPMAVLRCCWPELQTSEDLAGLDTHAGSPGLGSTAGVVDKSASTCPF